MGIRLWCLWGSLWGDLAAIFRGIALAKRTYGLQNIYGDAVMVLMGNPMGRSRSNNLRYGVCAGNVWGRKTLWGYGYGAYVETYGAFSLQ